jgi:hypothetical protein
MQTLFLCLHGCSLKLKNSYVANNCPSINSDFTNIIVCSNYPVQQSIIYTYIYIYLFILFIS